MIPLSPCLPDPPKKVPETKKKDKDKKPAKSKEKKLGKVIEEKDKKICIVPEPGEEGVPLAKIEIGRQILRKYLTKDDKPKKIIREKRVLPEDDQCIAIVVKKDEVDGTYEVIPDNYVKHKATMGEKLQLFYEPQPGDYVLIQSTAKGDRYPSQIVTHIDQDYIEFYKTYDVWPKAFQNSPSISELNKKAEIVLRGIKEKCQEEGEEEEEEEIDEKEYLKQLKSLKRLKEKDIVRCISPVCNKWLPQEKGSKTKVKKKEAKKQLTEQEKIEREAKKLEALLNSKKPLSMKALEKFEALGIGPPVEFDSTSSEESLILKEFFFPKCSRWEDILKEH